MTFEWTIDGLGTNSQTLVITDPDSNEIHSETREGWVYTDRPDVVDEVVAKHDVSAVLSNDIENV